ncbi:unnamed protein product [Angiostrongylus costaricensis]|uniref:Trifunctional purine biosynthetic protein adenosine-3 n=1 Tax=Angiostrongylus costaricensis TaxID=334426 RepID=A0A158PFA7_ANGCS|nr:unnamed protein product [Angiostrongylus costaricensis]
MRSVLVVGAGGREHAIAWHLANSGVAVWMVPGNGAGFPKPDVDIANADDVVVFCRREQISLIIVGPEGPLADGFVDRIGGRVAVFGPTQQGAQLEASKVFSKTFMWKYKLPTANFAHFDDIDRTRTFIEKCEWDGIVVKADGLAAGKGVVVADDKHSAIAAAEEFLAVIKFPEFLFKISKALCFTDGTTIARMPLIRDHKRLCENNLGPNTGGMGVVGPVTVSDAVNQQIDLLLIDTVASLRQEGIMYKGVIYAGLMITSSGPKLLEYNCRFGDPETEVIIMRLLKSDLYSICMSCTNGTLSEHLPIEWDKRHACGIVIATDKYPHGSDKGTLIETLEDTVIFHCGTTRSANGRVVTNGGRILCVTSLAVSAVEARAKAVQACESVQFVGKFFRRDIGLEGKEITPSITYQDSGVDIDEGNAFVEDIKALVQSTLRKGTGQIGGFGAVVDLTTAGFPSGSQLVIGIDGVGTKIEIADIMEDYTGIGYDVVGMCVNDVLCHCSTPVAFVDYFVSGQLNRPRAREVVASITRACIDSECSLVGGETAEMPGVYSPTQWDLAGCVVAVRESNWPLLPDSKSMHKGDVLIGLRSSGLHSNGFSLVRKIFELNNVSYKDRTPWDPEKTFGEVLLTPTRLYVRSLLPLLKEGFVKGCAHITGGGIEENAIRMLDPTASLVDAASWKKPAIFDWLAAMGPVTASTMMRTFNWYGEHGQIREQESYRETQKSFEEFNTLLSLISNKEGVKGLEIANAMGVETIVIPHTQVREEGDSKITEALRARNVQLICLAGYMRVLSADFIQTWRNRIINVHPSILPSFRGAHAVRDALKFGAKVTGCTIHYVDEQVDHGSIIAQGAVQIEDEDDEASLHAKIQVIEHKLYPEAMQRVSKMLICSE